MLRFAKLRLLAEFCRAGYPELSTLPGVGPAVQRALENRESLDADVAEALCPRQRGFRIVFGLTLAFEPKEAAMLRYPFGMSG